MLGMGTAILPSSLENRQSSQQSEPVSPRHGRTSRQSAGSNKSYLDVHHSSVESSLSIGSRFSPNVSDWNEKTPRETHTGSANFPSRHAADPPRPAKEGYEWVWFPEGYWAEREQPTTSLNNPKNRKWFNRSQDRQSKPFSPSEGDTTNKLQSGDEIPQIAIVGKSSGVSPRDSKTVEDSPNEVDSPASRVKRGLQLLSPMHPHFISPTGQPEGLYYKVKREIETLVICRRQMSDECATTPEYSLPSGTTLLLEGTSGYFDRQYSEQGGTNQGYCAPAPPQTPTSANSRLRRGFGLAPWHRKSSRESDVSVSSSVRRLLMGKAPSVTPAPEKQYSGQTGGKHDRIEISEPGQSTFLPSEARRIKTPPLSEDNSATGQPQGILFDTNHLELEEPHIIEKSQSSNLITGSFPLKRACMKEPIISPGWWEERNPARVAAVEGLARKQKLQTEMNLPPEHLPNSPLCPKNLMHESKGRGICAYHGRWRSTDVGNTSEHASQHEFGLYET